MIDGEKRVTERQIALGLGDLHIYSIYTWSSYASTLPLSDQPNPPVLSAAESKLIFKKCSSVCEANGLRVST